MIRVILGIPVCQRFLRRGRLGVFVGVCVCVCETDIAGVDVVGGCGDRIRRRRIQA